MADDSNLCPAERGGRLRVAVGSLLVALVGVVVVRELRLSPWWLVLASVPVFAATLELVQAYTGVCVFHARRGTRATAGVVEAVLDPRLRRRVAVRGKRVLATSAMIAITCTGMLVLVALSAA